MKIAGRPIGHEPYIVCELSGNHGGTLAGALRLLEAAAATGADAVKIQSYTPDTITIDHDFRIDGGLWEGRNLYDLYREAHTPFEWHSALFRRARELGVTLFSSPFDISAANMLEGLGCPAYKIASFELVDLPLIAHVARFGKPMIMSTGMASHEEIGEAVVAARESGCNDIALLHCVSAYPAPVETANVSTVPLLAREFDCISGLSDHTMGTATSVAAVALGASIIEKHFTLSDEGPDAAFSLRPHEFAALVMDCRDAWRSLGMPGFGSKGMKELRRSLYVVEDISEGELFTTDNIRSIRPGNGMAPKHLPWVIGKRAQRDFHRGEPLQLQEG